MVAADKRRSVVLRGGAAAFPLGFAVGRAGHIMPARRTCEQSVVVPACCSPVAVVFCKSSSRRLRPEAAGQHAGVHDGGVNIPAGIYSYCNIIPAHRAPQ